MYASRKRRFVAPLAALASLISAAGIVVVATSVGGGAAAAAEIAPFPATGDIAFHANGNGHGHGLSQYGAQGAAGANLTAAQILAFYYPGTALTTFAASTIRVKLSSATPLTTVFAGTTGLAVTKHGALPTTGYSYFRLIPNSTGLTLQGEKTSTTTWTTLDTTLPAQADFSTTPKYVRVLFANGTSTWYYGTVGAYRTSATAELSINRVPLDLYTQGVVPREMPASWRAAAVAAQAVAVRSYGKSEMVSNAGNSYDICDSSACQVYGGYKHLNASGVLQYSDDPAAIVGNQNEVLTYQGAPIFAQFSASNGGATADGGKPYLIAKVDPYDTAASGDPYVNRPGSISVATLAADFGLKTITSITITKRDGIGTWGGRVLTANVVGKTSTGTTTTIATDGFTLADDIGALTNWFRFDTEVPIPTAPTPVSEVAGDAGATISWTAPGNAAQAGITGYRVTFGGRTLTAAASARSLYISPIPQYSKETVSVVAVGSSGVSPAGTVAVQGAPAPSTIVPLPPTFLFHTATGVVDATHPYTFTVGGVGGVPASATAVQLNVGVIHGTAPGVLTVTTKGASPSKVAAIAYSATYYTSVTVSIPLVPSTSIVFTPSAGSLEVMASAMSYSIAGGSKITPIAPVSVSGLVAVPGGSGAVVTIPASTGISASTQAVVVQVDGKAPGAGGWFKVWTNGASVPSVEQVAVTPGGSGANTFIVPVTSAHQLRLWASAASMTGRITVVGLVGTTGGSLETFPVYTTADNASPSHPAVKVGTSAVSVPVAGVVQVPATGVAAVLMQITVSGSAAGSLYAYPTGGTKPAAPVVVFPAGGSHTATALVRVGTGGAVTFVSTSAGATVSIDSLGYVTTS